MKTNLAEQTALINQMSAEPNKIRRVVLLREWLKDHGYEGSADCAHVTVYRRTGMCTSCRTYPEMGPNGSDEALETLRERLGS